ncbi:ABHD3-like protein, partial [Mya arenaria]
KPLLACKDKKLRQFLANHVPIVFEKFWPTFWCFESRAMTIIRSFIETSPDIIELLSMPDGGQVRLDWMNNNDSPQYPDNDTRPTTPRTYCAANTEDLGRVVHYVKSKYPDAPLMGTGVSLGGMILFSYLAKTGKDCGMLAGMCVSMAWNVNMHLFESHIDDVHHVLKSTTIREFDDRFTAPMFGYQTWEDYYRDACIHDKVHALEVPVLCLNAADDPFSPHYVNEAEDNDNIAILVTSHGGHIGFLDGLLPRQPTYMYRMFSQYMDGLF